MKQKQVQKKATKKAEPSAPKKKPVLKKKVEESIDIEEIKKWVMDFRPNHFKLAMMDFQLAFNNLWKGIKGLFKK